MRELKTEVPQVFEPGARVAWEWALNVGWVITRAFDERWWVTRGASADDAPLCRIDSIPVGLRVVAPAPREGQRWTGSGHPLLVDGQRLQDPIATARWLLENGFDYAGEVSPALPAPPPVAALEPLAPPRSPEEPTPWTRDDARRLILATIADATPRRPAAFTSAMCSLAEDEAPAADVIGATASAIEMLEAALPEHGAVADWQRRRALSRITWFLKDAVGVEWAVDGLMACDVYLSRRAAC
jgi:hypothetical protein